VSAKEAGKQKQHLGNGELGASAKAPGQGQQGAAPHATVATAAQAAEHLEDGAAARAKSRSAAAQRNLEQLEGMLGGALREVLKQARAEAAQMDAAQQKDGAAPKAKLRSAPVQQEREQLEKMLGEGAIPDTLRSMLQRGKFPENTSAAKAQAPQKGESAAPGCVHPKDMQRRKAAQALQTWMSGATANDDGGGTIGTGTYRTTGVHLSQQGALDQPGGKHQGTGGCEIEEQALREHDGMRRLW
jgi:hypothetical protein